MVRALGGFPRSVGSNPLTYNFLCILKKYFSLPNVEITIILLKINSNLLKVVRYVGEKVRTPMSNILFDASLKNVNYFANCIPFLLLQLAVNAMTMFYCVLLCNLTVTLTDDTRYSAYLTSIN